MKLLRYLMIFTFILSSAAKAEKLTVDQMIQQVISHYPSIRTAAIQVELAQQEIKKVESRLGWQLNASAGINHETSLFGSPVDTLKFTGGFSRQLESGHSINLTASLQHDDADAAISPLLPNPSRSTNLDLNYRMPLSQNQKNSALLQERTGANTSTQLNESEYLSLLDRLAEQVINLYFSAANTRIQITNSQQSIERSLRLQRIIEKRSTYGIAEDKDILQIKAQIKSQNAQIQALEILSVQQQAAINRLTGKPWNTTFEPITDSFYKQPVNSVEKNLTDAKEHSPLLKTIQARLDLSDSKIRFQRDARKDKLDLVLFVGDRDTSGDIVAGDYHENELIGGARLEFQRSLDLSGFDAALYQAQLERKIALQDKVQILEDLEFSVVSTTNQLNASYLALDAYNESIRAEKEKLAEAELRYRNGRTDIDVLIQFENHLSNATLSASLQKQEIQRLTKTLSLTTGEIWDAVVLPTFDYAAPEIQ